MNSLSGNLADHTGTSESASTKVQKWTALIPKKATTDAMNLNSSVGWCEVYEKSETTLS